MKKFWQFLGVVLLAVVASYLIEGKPKGYKLEKIADFDNINLKFDLQSLFVDENENQILDSLKRAYYRKDTTTMETIIWNLRGKYYKKDKFKYYIANYYLLKKNYSEAFYVFGYKYRNKKFANDSTYLLIATILNKYSYYGDYDAIELLRKFLKLHPQSDTAFFLLGVTYYNLNFYNDAVENFEKAIEANPKYISQLNLYLKAFEDIYSKEKYMQFLQRIASRSDNAYQVNLALAKYYTWKDVKDDSAFYYAQKVVKQIPDDNWGNYLLAEYYYRKKAYSRALKHIDISIQKDSIDAYNNHLKGLICFYLKDYPAAIKHLTYSTNKFASDNVVFDKTVYLVIAESNEMTGNLVEAKRYYAKYVITPNLSEEDKTKIYQKIEELDKKIQ